MTPSAPDYRFVFRHLPGNYLLLAPDGTVVDHSEGHVVASMRNRDFTIGRHVFDAFPSSPESHQQLLSSHDEVRRTHQPHTILLRYDLERPAEQGGGMEERHWQAAHYPLLNEAGELVYILQIPEDVTKQQVAK